MTMPTAAAPPSLNDLMARRALVTESVSIGCGVSGAPSAVGPVSVPSPSTWSPFLPTTLPLPEIPDEAAYVRFCEKLRTDYAHLTSPDYRAQLGFADLAHIGSDVYADSAARARINYIYRRMTEDWAAFVARDAVARGEAAPEWAVAIRRTMTGGVR